jgi:hypothetical protein
MILELDELLKKTNEELRRHLEEEVKNTNVNIGACTCVCNCQNNAVFDRRDTVIA